MSIRKKIQEALEKAAAKASPAAFHKEFVVPPLSVQVTSDPSRGDYTSTLPFQLARVWGKNPEEIGTILKNALYESSPKNFFKNIEAVRGFLNVALSPGVLEDELRVILKEKSTYGSDAKKKEQHDSYSLDYLDANPTGPVHVGHARSGFLGDCIARVLKKAGYAVSREFYVNNAKSSGQIRSLGKTALGIGEEYKHEQMREILRRPAVKAKLKKIKDRRQPQDEQEKEAGFFIASIIQKENETFLKKAGIQYDLFFEEQGAYDKKLIDAVLSALRHHDVLYEKEGALWFRASQFGDTEDRVFVRSTGEPTYVLPDLAYHWDRLVRRKFTHVIDIFGADHHGYGPRLKGALAALGIDPRRVSIITTQTVRLMKGGEEFKMSKRKGVFVTLEELIAEVGLDAARFFFLAQSPDTHMDFDLTLAKEQSQKNPVYYVQYSHARIASILRKVSSVQRSAFRNKNSGKLTALLKEKEELELMKKLVQFPEIVEDTAKDYHVVRLTTYATDLARTFHHFYEKHRVISDDVSLTAARLSLVRATQIILKNTLELMGISAPEKM